MSIPSSPISGTGADHSARRSIASFSCYQHAQRAVDFLSDRHFPVERVSIVGRDLEYIEQVTGRLTTARAASQGALIGLFFAVLFGLFFTSPRPTWACCSTG